MDIVKFWGDVAQSFDADRKCGFCWFYGAPLDLAAANLQQAPEDKKCCTHILVTDLTTNSVKGYASSTGFLNSQFDDYNFTIHVVRQDDIGTNTYNEINDHPIEEGKWETILRPLQECLEDTPELEKQFCNLLGKQLRITAWRMSILKNYADNNYTGWEIRGTFREKII